MESFKACVFVSVNPPPPRNVHATNQAAIENRGHSNGNSIGHRRKRLSPVTFSCAPHAVSRETKGSEAPIQVAVRFQIHRRHRPQGLDFLEDGKLGVRRSNWAGKSVSCVNPINPGSPVGVSCMQEASSTPTTPSPCNLRLLSLFIWLRFCFCG